MTTNRGMRLEIDRELRPFAEDVDGAFVSRLKRV